MRAALISAMFLVLAGCGKQALTVEVDPAGAAGAMAQAGRETRAPGRHRATGATCPLARAPGKLRECPPEGSPADNPDGCLHDSECTSGANGRCVPLNAPFFTCRGTCSYDECSGDSACPAATPCECRASETVVTANRCVGTSNCRVDADCGPGGFCSPSVVNPFCACLSPALCDSSSHCYAGDKEVPCSCGDACGHGYYCHTGQDQCLDDEDCGAGQTCNYDRLEDRWTCSTCWPFR
jgi:hypothetical protein